MHERIRERLKEIEKEHHIKILYAVESGSRAWGFASKDSDYDIRFIYVHHLHWYLRIFPERDVIEYPIDKQLLDISGWDLKKTLGLLSKSNPVLYEWLQSPIVYYEDSAFLKDLQNLATHFFRPTSTLHHYLHMAENNYKEYLQGDMVKIKKYFYVLRPVLTCLWIEKYNSPPPMLFEELVKNIIKDTSLMNVISILLERKRRGDELSLEPSIPEINAFLDQSIIHIKDLISTLPEDRKDKGDLLDEFFLRWVMKA